MYTSNVDLAIWHALYVIVFIYACIQMKKHPGPSICVGASIILILGLFFAWQLVPDDPLDHTFYRTMPYVFQVSGYIGTILIWVAAFGWRSDYRRRAQDRDALFAADSEANAGPRQQRKWLLNDGKGTELGPYTDAELQGLYAAHRINGDTLSFQKPLPGGAEWKPLSDYLADFRGGTDWPIFAMRNTSVPLTSGSISVPRMVRAYGMIIMILNAIGMGLAVLSTLIWVSRLEQQESPVAFSFVLGYGAICIGISFSFFRLGKGLRLGERQAVYSLCGLGGLVLLASAAFLVRIPPVGLVLLLIVATLYVPPVVSAFRHWSAFR